MNEGACIGDSLHPNCGPGNQIQVRTCTDGSNASRFPVERCTVEDKRRTVSCAVSGTELPNCITEGILNEISNYLIHYHILRKYQNQNFKCLCCYDKIPAKTAIVMEIVLKERAIVMMTRIVFLDLSVNLMVGGEMTFVRQV